MNLLYIITKVVKVFFFLKRKHTEYNVKLFAFTYHVSSSLLLFYSIRNVVIIPGDDDTGIIIPATPEQTNKRSKKPAMGTSRKRRSISVIDHDLNGGEFEFMYSDTYSF